MAFPNRQYDPQLGRFLAVEPLADAGGQHMLSPYAAMGNNPAMMIDPLGLKFDMGVVANPHVMTPQYDMGGQKDNRPGANDGFTEWIASTAGNAAKMVEGARKRSIAVAFVAALGLYASASKSNTANNDIVTENSGTMGPVEGDEIKETTLVHLPLIITK